MKTNSTSIILSFLLIVLSSCSAYDPDGDHLYDKVGYEPGSRSMRPDPRVNRSANVPDYYYRYDPRVPASEYQPPQQVQPQYQYAPQQYAPYPAQPYSNYQAPGSRFYANPYDVPPSPYYSQPYDSDQYYVPPNRYYNQGQSAQVPVDKGSSGVVHY